jgi:hypothetical protein
MTTLTITKARAKLADLCKRAKQGEEIGIIAGNQVLQLRPVVPGEISIVPMTDGYLSDEYGLTSAEIAAFQRRERARYRRNKRNGKIVTVKGKFDPSILS